MIGDIARRMVRDCPACGRLPVISVYQDSSGGIVVRARCHGSTEIWPLDDLGNETVEVGRLAAWLRRLFALDAMPDVRELIRYNAEPFA
jgi:hypothetical protein